MTIDYNKISERRQRSYRIIQSQYDELYQLFLELIENAFKSFPDIYNIVLIGNSPFNDGDTVSFTLYDPLINDSDRWAGGWPDGWRDLCEEIESFAEVLEAEHDSGWKLTFSRDKSDKCYNLSKEDYYD